MQIDASFCNRKSEPSARALADVCASPKWNEQTLLILIGNANSAIAHRDQRIRALTLQRERDGAAGFRILHRVVQQIHDDVAEQPIVETSFRQRADLALDLATVRGGGGNFIRDELAKRGEIVLLPIQLAHPLFHFMEEQ